MPPSVAGLGGEQLGGSRSGRHVVGRAAEIERLAGALTAARSGTPTVVLLEGEPGTGKTTLAGTLLRDGPALPATASGDEGEMVLDYGVVDQLVRALPPDLRVRAPDVVHPDPWRTGAALVELVEDLGLDQPLVVVVDDAQWADDPSLQALTFGARRLRSVPVLVCVTCRTDGLGRLPPGLLRLAADSGGRIALGPLDASAVAELARAAYGRRLPDLAAERLRAHTGGNPLHTVALLDDLPFDAVAGHDPLPAPRSYAGLVAATLDACPPAAVDLARALAVLGQSAPLALAVEVAGLRPPAATSTARRPSAALAGLGPGAPLAQIAAIAGLDGLGPATTAGLGGGPQVPAVALEATEALAARGVVTIADTRAGREIAFAHGVVRASVVGGLTLSQRVALHRRAAAVTRGDEALRHRLVAAEGPEPELVAAAADRARHHASEGAALRAARLLLDAAPAAGSTAERERLVIAAAGHLVGAGQGAGELGGEIEGFGDSVERSALLGRMAVLSGRPAEARVWLDRTWERLRDGEGGPAELVAPVADAQALLALNEARWDDLTAWARRALDAGSDSGISASLLAHGLVLGGGFGEAEDEMTALLDRCRPGTTAARDAAVGRGVARLWHNDLDGAGADLRLAADALAGRGSPLARVELDSYLAEAAFRAGRWHEALDLASGAALIVDDAGAVWLGAPAHGVATFVLAARGELDPARRHAAAAATSAELTGLFAPRLWSRHAALRLAEAEGDHAAVVAAGDAILDDGWGALPEGIHHWRAAYAEALIAVGRVDDAAGAAKALAHAAATDGDAAVATDAARALGAVATARRREDEADAAFARGLSLDPARSRPFPRARLELAAGGHLRRTGRRRDAAELLATAADRLAALGAGPWAERCRGEMTALGLRPRKRSGPPTGELTAQEGRVADLVASGLSNREVAAELLISTKTVEHHLGRVYAKLGLRSRTELVRHIVVRP
jgi:DNA-binding CsgD family transcriptional regulator